MFYATCSIFSTQVRAKTFIHCSSLCGNIHRTRKRLLHNDLLQNRQGICTLPHENSLSITEIMINFLTCSVRIYVRNVA